LRSGREQISVTLLGETHTMEIQWDLLLTNALAIILGLCCIGIWLFGLIKRRPIIFSVSTLVGLFFLFVVFLCYSIIYQLVQLFGLFDQADDYGLFTGPFSWILIGPIVFFIATLVFMIIIFIFVIRRRPMRYMLCGVNDTTLREALIYALNRLNLPFNETLWHIQLLSLNLDLRVNMTAWRGIVLLSVQPRHHIDQVKELAAGMNEYYKQSPVKVDFFSFFFFLMIGILMLIMTASI
jgi:uncharacterized membrane protein